MVPILAPMIFASALWKDVKILSWMDIDAYLANIELVLAPGSKLPSISSAPEQFNPQALHAILLIQRYSNRLSPQDLVLATFMMLKSVSLIRDPGYAYFFFHLATHSLNLFERTTELPHLDRTIDVLDRLYTTQEQGTNIHLLAGLLLSSACLQYSFKAAERQAQESALQIIDQLRQIYSKSPWSSSFGHTRTLFILGDALRHRYHIFGPDEDTEGHLLAINSILDILHDPIDHQLSALQILVIGIISFLSQTQASHSWMTSLDALLAIVRSLLISQPENKPRFTNVSSDALDVLINTIDQCSISLASRATCLIHMADVLGCGEHAEIIEDYDDHEISEETSSLWTAEWDAACQLLLARIQLINRNTKLENGEIRQQSQRFRILSLIAERREPQNIRFRQSDPPGTHICIFQISMIPADMIQSSGGSEEPITHALFYRYLQKLCKGLSQDELEGYIEHPDTLDSFLERSRHLVSGEEPLLKWKQSSGVIAYLILRRQTLGINNTIEAAAKLLTVNLEEERGYEHFVYQIAARLIRHENNTQCIDLAARLFTEFLRIQQPKSSKLYLAILDLTSTFATDFLNSPGRLSLLAVALEMFREALESRGPKPWVLEARKVIVLGRILRYRFKTFESSDEELESTIMNFDALWDLLPVGRPFSASALECITASTLLYLAQDLDARRWIDAMSLLHATLQLYINGSSSTSLRPSLNFENIETTCQDLLDGGFRIVSYSMASEALCLLHISDMLRSTALDSCEHPNSFPISAKMYQRDLRLHSSYNSSHFAAHQQTLRNCWNKELGELQRVVAALALDAQGNSESPATIDPAQLSIFRYHAGTLSSKNAPTSFQHSCILVYHPTRVSYLPEQPNDDSFAPTSPPESPSDSDFPEWPADFMPLSFESRPIVPVPSTIIPGIEKVIHDESHEFFKLPLESRTIRALIRNLDHDVRRLETQTSHLSEKLISQASEAIFWDPRDIQINTRIAKLKTNTPFLAQMGPLQALLSRGPEKCLELIENARAHFWTRLLRLKTSFDALPDRHLAQRLEQVTRDLEACKSQFSASVSKEEMQKQFDLEGEFAHLLKEARDLPGFEGLLKPKPHTELLEASVGGPVIVLLGTNSTYAALIVRPQGVDAVLLDGLTDNVLENMAVGLNKAGSTARDMVITQPGRNAGFDEEGYDRAIRQIKTASHVTVLDQLWKFVIKPIFRVMGFTLSSASKNKRPRLWWCPTGRFTFLPLHAAQSKSNVLENVSKYVISSYTPTLSALISARRSFDSAQPWHAQDLKALVLAQPQTKGRRSLPMTLKELEIIESIVPSVLLSRISSMAGTPLSESNINRTVDEAMDGIDDGVAVLHLACHGHQDHNDPLNSGFELANGRLTLSKLISRRTPNAFLAFLSACESASNDLEIPDETLNLSAAMLYAGFRSVIGTMWTMNDSDGPEVTRAVYEELFKDPCQVLDPSIIPEALDSALQKFQNAGMHPSRWATYIHVGI